MLKYCNFNIIILILIFFSKNGLSYRSQCSVMLWLCWSFAVQYARHKQGFIVLYRDWVVTSVSIVNELFQVRCNRMCLQLLSSQQLDFIVDAVCTGLWSCFYFNFLFFISCVLHCMVSIIIIVIDEQNDSRATFRYKLGERKEIEILEFRWIGKEIQRWMIILLVR